jgi:Carboxypeptidase regulatory-like domain/TonB dependent receptor
MGVLIYGSQIMLKSILARRVSRKGLTLALAAMLIASAACCFGQTAGTGTITGVVTDSSGAVIPNATVVITNTDTGASRTIRTNNDGSYTATFLQPGHYEVVLGGGAFGRFDQKEINLTVGRTLAINASLAAATVASEVIVNATPPVLDTEKTEVSQTVSQQLISNLPVNGRRWDDFVLLTPNVVPDGGSGLVAFHGISGLYNQDFVDGANNNQMLFSEARGRASGAPYVYSLDSIKEFEAETSNYSAEFGQAAGGQVNAITRSGTNAIHGDLFYYLRYPSFNALDPYSKWTALYNHGNPFLLTQPIHQQQQFGGSVGGPIIKDKLFYFFTYDGFRRVGRVLYYTTDTVSLTPSGPTTSTSTITPTQCPATISAAQCTSAIQFVQDLAGVGINPPSRFAKENIFFPRLDYDLNEKNHFFVNFNFADFDSTNGYSPNPTYSNSSVSTNGPTSYHERFLIANWTATLTNNSVNEVRFQWGRDLETAGANAPGPSVTLNGLEAYGMPNALPRLAEPDEHRYQITDIFSTQKGRHTFKFGGDANIVQEVMINLYQGGGLYSYIGTPIQAFQNWAVDAFRGQDGDTAANQGTHYSTFVQTIDAINPLARAGADDFYMQMYDGFAEDTWKVRPNLVLNLGVRYDFQLTPSPAKPNTSSAIAEYYNSTIKNVSDRVQPRLGFAWNPHPGTVVRGGYGIFSALNQGSTYYAMRVENGVYQINYSFNGGPTAPVLFPNVPFAVTGPALTGALYPTGGTAPAVVPLTGGTLVPSFHGLSPNFVPPNAHELSLAVEQLLPAKLTLSVGYVGTRALHLPVFIDANLVGQKSTGLRTYDIVNSAGAVTSVYTTPFYLPADRSNTALGSLNTGFSAANSWYNSMATTIRRPFDNGLELLVNYTWSKALDDDQVSGTYGTFYGGNPVLDPNNLKGEYGRSDLDVRNRFVGSLVYQPMLFRDNKYVKYLVDGFVFAGIATEQTGFPIVASLSGYPSGGADGGVTGGVMSSGSGTATAGRPPQIARNSQPGPGTRNIDLRVSRDFPIHESIHFQITGEAFNLLNQKIIAGVNSTYSTYTAANTTTCTGTPAPGAIFQGCLGPYVSSTAAFGTASSTNSLIFGPRQLQISARFTF